MFCVYWARDKNIIVNHVAKYKETASKSSRKYEKVRGGGEALADQEMGPGWSINSSIMSPEINLKCTEKQPTTKNPMGGSQRPPNPQLLNSARCARHIFISKLTLRYTQIKAFGAYTKIIPGYAPVYTTTRSPGVGIKLGQRRRQRRLYIKTLFGQLLRFAVLSTPFVQLETTFLWTLCNYRRRSHNHAVKIVQHHCRVVLFLASEHVTKA